jgi:hypothetical protein
MVSVLINVPCKATLFYSKFSPFTPRQNHPPTSIKLQVYWRKTKLHQICYCQNGALVSLIWIPILLLESLPIFLSLLGVLPRSSTQIIHLSPMETTRNIGNEFDTCTKSDYHFTARLQSKPRHKGSFFLNSRLVMAPGELRKGPGLVRDRLVLVRRKPFLIFQQFSRALMSQLQVDCLRLPKMPNVPSCPKSTQFSSITPLSALGAAPLSALGATPLSALGAADTDSPRSHAPRCLHTVNPLQSNSSFCSYGRVGELFSSLSYW